MDILLLQKQKGEGHLFVVAFPGWEEVAFKLPSLLRIQQYVVALSVVSQPTIIFEQIFRECVVDEALAFHRENIPAGVVQSLAELVLLLSGAGDNAIEYTVGLHQTFRAQTAAPIVFMKRIICATFGGYTFSSLEELDYQALCELFVQAERIMLDSGIIEEEYQMVIPRQDGGYDFVKDAAEIKSELEGGKASPRKSSSPAVQEAMREARMNLLREARTKAARQQTQKAKPGKK